MNAYLSTLTAPARVPTGSLDFALSRLPPYGHQREGVEVLVANPMLLLADDMGLGKTKQCIDAASFLFLKQLITRVIVVAPSPVRGVWFDPNTGELEKHLWHTIPSVIVEHHAKKKVWRWAQDKVNPQFPNHQLEWIITNYEFIRQPARLEELLKYCSKGTILILDESSLVKNWSAKQTKACYELRLKCGWVWQLNGTPIANSPLDIYSQARILHPKILDCSSFYHFRSKYAVITTRGGFPKITGWQNLGDMQARLAPYVVRRLKEDCLDLPGKLPPVTLTVPLTERTWSVYREMRDQLVAWLTETEVVTAGQAMVKALRLAQITSGYLGGAEEAIVSQHEGLDIDEDDDVPAWVNRKETEIVKSSGANIQNGIAYLGTEKLDMFLQWLDLQLDLDPSLKLLVWCRFRVEAEMIAKALASKSVQVGMIWGSQKPEERKAAIELLDPRTMPKGPVVVVGTTATGAMGLTLVGSHTVFYYSNDYSHKIRVQSEDRVDRPGQTQVISYFDLVATGPAGQRTVNHTTLAALKEKRNVADMTISAWIHELTQE